MALRARPRLRFVAVLALLGAEALALLAFTLAALPYPVPVQGIVHAAVPRDWHAPREGGHLRHQGVDLVAPRGTPVRSIGWGVIVGIEEQRKGGKVVFVLGRGALLAFYAHLDAWAPGLHVGQWVTEGELLGVVGDTGNARGTVPHLHFETRPAATFFAPVDPRLVVGPRPPEVSARMAALVASLPEPR